MKIQNVLLVAGMLLFGLMSARAEGLVGDGVHDDTAAIQAMLDAGRSCVYLPPPQSKELDQNCRQTSAVPGEPVFLSQKGTIGTLEHGTVSK